MTALVARFKNFSGMNFDGAWVAIFLVILAVGLFDPGNFVLIMDQAAGSLLSTLPYVIVAILMIAFLKASGGEIIIAEAFKGRETRMIIFAALLGGLAPFCSCEVIPFVAGLLALGTPLSAVMAFWLASPLMDPSALLITAGALGWNFAVFKLFAAIGLGLMGGFLVMAYMRFGGFANPLREQKTSSCCSAPKISADDKVVWRFWEERERREEFVIQGQSNAEFLVKWLTLAYLLESLMVNYIPAELIASIIGGDGVGPILLSALVGAPAYLNSYAAPPLVAGLMEQGMSGGAGMAFMIAGGVSCIPAMTAVYALVNKTVFATYVLIGFSGAVISGLLFAAIA